MVRPDFTEIAEASAISMALHYLPVSEERAVCG